MLTTVALAFAAAAVLASIFILFAAFSCLEFRRRPKPAAAPLPGVSVLKPICGDEYGLRESLGSFCTQRYPEYEILFGAFSPDDGAIPAAEDLRAEYAHLPTRLLFAGANAFENRKIAILAALERNARYDLLLWADSDIEVAEDHLAVVANALNDPKVGAVTCPYIGVSDEQLASRLGAMWINFHFTPLAIFSKRLGLAQGCFGSTIAMSKRTLGVIGGFERFGDRLADDFAVGRAVRSAGLGLVFAPVVARTTVSDGSFKDLWRRETRWQMTIRYVAGPGHYFSILTHPLVMAFLAVTLAGGATWAIYAFCIVYLIRYAGCAVIAHSFDVPAPNPLLLLVRDLLSFVVFAKSLVGSDIEWRGRRFRIKNDGVLKAR